MILGIDVGGTKIAVGLVDACGNISHSARFPTSQSSDGSAVEQLVEIVRDLSSEALTGIGVGVPGIADPRTDRVWAPNIRGWNQIPLRQALESRSRGRPVVVESDRNTAVLAEVGYGLGRGRQDLIVLILGTGIGAGIYSGGRILRGHREIAGAIGWLPVFFRGEVQHFEAVAAGPAIERLARGLGLAEDLHSLARQARTGAGGAQELFREVGEVVGQVAATLVSTFNPELVVVGGGLSNIWELIGSSAAEAMRKWSQPIAAQQVEILPSALGDRAGILGAAAAFQLVKGD